MKLEQNVVGLPVQEVIGKNDLEIFGEQGVELRAWDKRLFDTGTTVNYESKINRKRWESDTFWTSKSPLRDSNGQLIGLIGVSRDVTEAREAEEKYKFIFEKCSCRTLGGRLFGG